MDLRKELAKIVKLQGLDGQIYRLRQQKDIEKPSLLERLRIELQEKRKALEDCEKELKDLQVKRKNKELDLAAKEDLVKKAQGQLYQLKSNKEYQAKLNEISSLKADVSLLEEEVLKIFDLLAEAEAKYNLEKEKFLKEEQNAKQKEEGIRQDIKEIEEEIKHLEAERSEIAKEIEPNLLNKYERLLSTRSGLAVAAVDNENCNACHMRVTAQTINEIKMYKDLIFCENCVRILYVPEDITDA